jgi:hypothetical protein
LARARSDRTIDRVLSAMERMLGVGDSGRSHRFWLIPGAVLLSTVLAFVVIGQVTAAPLYISIPNGVVIAFVMAGLTAACMMPTTDDAPPEDPPRDDDGDDPVLGSPGGPWLVVAHLGPSPSPAEVIEATAAALNRCAAADHR